MQEPDSSGLYHTVLLVDLQHFATQQHGRLALLWALSVDVAGQRQEPRCSL